MARICFTDTFLPKHTTSDCKPQPLIASPFTLFLFYSLFGCYTHLTILYYTVSRKESVIQSSSHFKLYFGENDLTVFMKKQEETLFGEYSGHLYGVTG